MKNLIIGLMALSCVNGLSQSLEWAKSVGSFTADIGKSNAIDGSGNVYTAGDFHGTVDFDPGAGVFDLTSTSIFSAAFIQKLDANGNFLWATKIAGNNCSANSIFIDGFNNVYTTGFFNGTADFDPGAGTMNLTSFGNADIYIQKLDASGNFIWAKQLGGVSNEYGQSVVVDDAGNAYVSGYFYGTGDFDPGLATNNLVSAGLFDAFITKLNAAGNFVWAKQVGGTGDDAIISSVLDFNGFLYTTGSFSSTVDFNPNAGTSTITSAGVADIFVQKLDLSGNLIWAKGLGGTSNDYGRDLAVDPYGNVYSTGYYYGTADFDPGVGTAYMFASTGSFDAFVSKLDIAGNFVWAKSVGGITGHDYGYSIALDDDSNVYTTGSFQGTVDFNPNAGTENLISEGFADIFIQKLDASGNYIWAKNIGSQNNDTGWSIALSSTNFIHATGNLNGVADFDPGMTIANLNSTGDADVFVLKWNNCSPTFSTDSHTECSSFTWIDGITYSASNSTATQTLINALGCDSIVTLNLTINQPTSSTISQTACVSYTWNGTTYNSSGPYSYVTTNSQGCDSTANLNLTIIGLPITTVSQSGSILTADLGGAFYQWIDCNASNSPLIGESGQVFSAQLTGNYAVIVTDDFCSDTSACIPISIIGIQSNSIKNIQVYPNPANNELTIQAEISLDKICLMDMNGRLVLEQKNTSDTSFKIDVSGIKSGVYFLQLTALNGDKLVQKIIKR